MTENLPGIWPPPANPVRITGVDLLMQDGAHPLFQENAVAIEENWQAEAHANPHLFNGQMVLQRQLAFDNGIIRGMAHAIPYSTLLWWRKQPTPEGALHLFGFAVLVSSDNAIVAIRMSAHTANPGMVYCAAGSLDLNDIVDGRLDLSGNMRREVREETGLDLDEADADPHFYASHADNRVVVFRFHRFSMTAAEMVARIEIHMPHDAEQEIDGAVVIRSADREAHHYNPMMFPILDMFFTRSDN
ncbi:8-oxo-dGTP pyrophosphatase MutT (NUDIX family) [Neorhizobium huautlense]|uniref:8-oxo-dGTP pyrophosphatase MutT (NUDIX family) n=1 Tax=Neorhizobium huautlense TaxID=67774 RepID=A0ABT9PSA9_9HYPH|nr:NUDIX hydrolase [Neorhizobium huautlense]MDP9836764.1 8-oxo-dGTP pyrophosphatase MutT (NUDIX family) [Neorhizobium huautlense]